MMEWKRWRRLVLSGVVLPATLAAVGLTGCSEEMTGPEPALEAPTPEADPLPVAPGIVCQDQLTTDVTLTGSNFSPVPIDVLDGTKLALPSVTLERGQTLTGEAAEPMTVVYSGNPDDETNRQFLSWHSQTEMHITVNQELMGTDSGMLPAGIHDVRVDNPNTNETTSVGALAVAPRPTLETATPPVVCLSEGERTVALAGNTFLDIEGQQASIDVSLEGTEQAADMAVELTDCQGIAHEGLPSSRICSGANLTLAQGQFDPGYYDLQLDNPQTAACESTDDVKLRVVPPPSIASIAPPMACVAQSERTFTIDGTDFLTIDGVTPTVTVAGNAYEPTMSGCTDLETQTVTVQTCTTMEIAIPQGDVEPGRKPVIVQNPEPAGCQNQDESFVTITSPPSITEVEPTLVCLDDGAREVVVRGTDFITVGDGGGLVLPEVQLDGNPIDPANVTAQDCTDLEVDRLGVQTCSELLVTISEDDVASDQPSVTVTNPDPAGCTDTQEQLLQIVPGPQIASAQPSLICTDDGMRDLTITGDNFLVMPTGEQPEVRLDGNVVTISDITGCAELTLATGETAQQCTTIDVSVDQGLLAAGDTVVEVENPAPAGCVATDSEVLTVPPTLAIDSLQPGTVCAGSSGGQVSVTVQGQGFLRVDGTDFTVTVDGDVTTPTNLAGCTTLNVDGLGVESCTSFDITIDTADQPEGTTWDIAVTNPAPSGCGIIAQDAFSVSAPPTLTSVQPDNVCADTTQQFTLNGSDFVQGTEVTFTNGTDTFSSANGDFNLTFVSATEMTADFSQGIPAGSYDVTVSNGQGCASTLSGAVAVDPEPIVFFVDPPVVYDGINTRVSIYVANVPALANANSVVAIDSGGNQFALTDAQLVGSSRIQATVPANTLAAGDYEIAVTTQLGCSGGLPGAMSVTDDDTGIDVAGIDPPFGWQNSSTSVVITANEAAAQDLHFDKIPRVYLNPTAGGAATATELQALTFNSTTELGGIVPQGLDLGSYDVIVVNPDGTVGILPGAYKVTAEPPPLVDSVSPGGWRKGEVIDALAFGENFRYGADPNTQLSITCQSPAGTTDAPASITVDGASSDATLVDFSVDTSGLTEFSICVVRWTNPDGTYGEFAPVVITNPATANNFLSFTTGGTLSTPRRQPAVSAGIPSRKQRFVYVIGGDDGTASSPIDSVEFSQVDRFGEPLGFETMPRHSLPGGGRGLSDAVRIGDFLYLVGGHTTTGATGDVSRSWILDPLHVPEIDSVDIAIDQGNGLATGTYYYRVSAVLSSNSAYNPDGETLTSQPLPFRVPLAIDGDVVPTITWSEFDGAVSYRIYRSVNPNDTFGDEQLIATVTDTGAASFSFTDDGTASFTAENPLPVGAIGTWHAPASDVDAVAISARFKHGVGVGQDPTTPQDWHIYAGGGNDGTNVLDSVDALTIAVNGPRDQVVTGVSIGAATLGQAREELDIDVVTNENIEGLTGGPLLYAFPGKTAGGGPTAGVEYFPISAGGSLGASTGLSSPNGTWAGYAGGISNNTAFVVGGFGASPSSDARKTQAQTDGTLGTWSAMGATGMTPLYLLGDAPFFGFLYVAGGIDDTNTVSSTVDYTVVGSMSR